VRARRVSSPARRRLACTLHWDSAWIRVARPPAREPTVAGDSAGGVGSQKFGSAARRSGTSIGARPSGPPPQVTRTSPRMSWEVPGASSARGARTLAQQPRSRSGRRPGEQRGRCSAKGVDASRAGRSSRSRSGRVVRSNANAVKKLNTPGQRSREDSGVHPGRSLFSREEAVGVEATRPPAAFSIGAKGCSWRGCADHVPARRYSSRIPRLVTVWPDCVSRIT